MKKILLSLGVLALILNRVEAATASTAGELETAIINANSGADTTNGDLVITSVLSGSGTLNKEDSGSLTLSGTNTYDCLSINGGTLSVATEASLGDDTTPTINGRALITTTGFDTSKAFDIGALNGTISPDESTTLILSGNLTGDGTLTKDGLGSLTLSGTNTFSALNVDLGTLSVGADGNLGSGTITVGGATLSTSGVVTVPRVYSRHQIRTCNRGPQSNARGPRKT